MSSIDLTDSGPDLGGEDIEQLDLPRQRPLEEEIIARSSGNFEPLPMLDVIFGRLVTAYAPLLKSQSGILADVPEKRLVYMPWGQAVSEMDEFGVAAIAKSSWGGDIAVAVDRVLMHGVIGSMLGGDPGPSDVPSRIPTTLEKAFSHRLMGDSLGLLAQHISRIVEVSFALDTVEAPAQVASFHSASSIVAMLEMEVQIGLLQGKISFLLPMQTLEVVRPQLGKMFLGEELGSDNGWRAHFAGHISGANTQVIAELHHLTLPLSDVLRWRLGETIDLGITTDHEATLICSGRPILHGATGRKRNGRMAMRITREVGEGQVESDDELFTD